jgi:predicted Zn finger-like uncharacterized protein
MFTCCPACQTLFRVRADVLRVAQGEVRCGRCGAQFNALESLAEDPEALAVNSATSPQTSEAEPPVAAGGPEARVHAATEPGGDAGQGALPGSSGADPATPGDASAIPVHGSMPGISSAVIQEALLTEDSVQRRRGPGVAAGSIVLLLLFVLMGQWLYMQRVPLYERKQLRPLLQGFCTLLACDLPLPRMPQHIDVVERMVREHPRVARALLVNVTLVSRAEEPIAYPILELRLADVSGNRVAGRRFAPAEYLPGDVDPRRGLLPQRPVALALELMAPTIDVVSFQFEFL